MSTIRNGLLAVTLLVGSSARAQFGQDYLGWGGLNLRVNPDSGAWTFDMGYQTIQSRKVGGRLVYFGTASVSYHIPRTGLTVGPGVGFGAVDQIGPFRLAMVRAVQTLPPGRWHPYIRLQLERIWLTDLPSDVTVAPLLDRVRLQFAIEPVLSKKWHGVANVEPFVFRTPDWFHEVRSQVGIRWLPDGPVTLDVLYYNRWAGYRPTRVSWEHALVLSLLIRWNGTTS